MSEFKKEEKKGGFWAPFSRMFGKGSSVSGGAARLGSSGSGFGGGGLFSTKAGVLGVILGGATIAAGVGVLYNFIGPSSRSGSNPGLFQDSYYDEQAQNASRERAQQKAGASASDSTLDMFREQARKDGLGLGAQEEADAGKQSASAEDEAAGGQEADAGAAAAPAAPAPNASAGLGGKLQPVAGFGDAKGGGSSAKMAMGGMQGAGNGQLGAARKSPVGLGAQGKSSAMKGSLASAVRNASKRSLSSAGKKGAFGQAKFAGNMGARSAAAPSMTTAKTGATEAFSGETSGTGDLGKADGGVGLGGAGISQGSTLKASDPNLNMNNSTPPKVPDPEDVSPWKKFTNMALYGMIAGALLVVISNMCTKHAMTLAAAVVTAPAAAAWYIAAQAAAYAAMAAAAVVIYAGIMLMSKYGQKWTGIMYMAAGAMIIWKAYEALTAAIDASATSATAIEDATRMANPGPAGSDAAATATKPGVPLGEATDFKGMKPIP
ncbi:MAG: hypothetical protein WCW52_11410 [Elusimicrobiales bacterium]|jgi:hypothetical protein